MLLCLVLCTSRDLRRASDAPVTGYLNTPLAIPMGSLNGSHGPFQVDTDGIVFGKVPEIDPKSASVAQIGLQAFWHGDATPQESAQQS